MLDFSEKEYLYVKDVLDNKFSGKYNKLLEQKFAYKFGSAYAIGVNSGTSALTTALHAVGVREDDEVIMPIFTFSAPAFAILHLGATPVFANVDKCTWNITPEYIEPLITSKTKAIIVVHLYGLPANMPAIMELAYKYNLKVIEDCAECFYGSYYIDEDTYTNFWLVGTKGDMSIFSFERSKHITSGSGGMIITNNEEYALNARRFSVLGYSTVGADVINYNTSKDIIQHPDFARHYHMGYNFRLPELCAAVALGQLDVMKNDNDVYMRRKDTAKLYNDVVKDFLYHITPQLVEEGYWHSYWTYVFSLKEATVQIGAWEAFRKIFKEKGGHDFYAAWRLVPDEPFFKKLGYIIHDYFYKKLQQSLVCLKTNFADMEYAKQQADILHETLKELYG